MEDKLALLLRKEKVQLSGSKFQYQKLKIVIENMQISQKKWTQNTGWQSLTNNTDTADLVLVFGDRKTVSNKKMFKEIKNLYKGADVVIGSSAGNIVEEQVFDEGLCLTAIKFESSSVRCAVRHIGKTDDLYLVTEELAQQVDKEGLKHVMVFSEGLQVNGTSLVHGLRQNLPKDIAVTGGLMGDGADFKETVVGLNEAPETGNIVIVGFYGEKLSVGHGSLGGWDSFGPERLITKSKNNVLYELDGKPALDIYKDYLGEKAKDLPGSGLLFPLSLRIKAEEGEIEVVRTLLAINEEEKTITFAGDMPEGTLTRLMIANFERLIDGASGAANMGLGILADNRAELVLMISCVGRKLVLNNRVEEEIEAVRDAVGPKAVMTGFYSYGEISPVTATENQCQLHNQTMTITVFSEK